MGPGDAARGLEQSEGWSREQREVRPLPDKLIDNVWDVSPEVDGKLLLMSLRDHGPKSGAGH